jgi:hypothetical protein
MVADAEGVEAAEASTLAAEPGAAAAVAALRRGGPLPGGEILRLRRDLPSVKVHVQSSSCPTLNLER